MLHFDLSSDGVKYAELMIQYMHMDARRFLLNQHRLCTRQWFSSPYEALRNNLDRPSSQHLFGQILAQRFDTYHR